jgi:hypothetical protein
MAPKRKADNERVKRREIHVNDETWREVKAAAKQQDLSISRYLVHCHETDTPKVNPEQIIALSETLQCIDQDLRDIAFAAGVENGSTNPLMLLKLVEIERHLRAIGGRLLS